MAETTEYITKAGDRWDTVAYRAYGSTDMINTLIEANPSVPISAVLPEGIRLQVPVMQSPEITINKSNLPPWKR